jgi:cytochrome c oxidase subunit 2
MSFFNTKIISFCDAAEAWQFGIQDPATPNLEGMIFFHDYLNFFLVTIVVFVCWFLITLFTNYNNETNKKPYKFFTHSNILEIVWTIIPAVILLLIAVPSFALLYSLDELVDPTVTVKVIGHQWYWSYEYSDFAYAHKDQSLAFDSYMVATSDLRNNGGFRLLEVDRKLVLPINTHIRVLVTAADVLHSWCVPSFGIKVDACPGRLTQASLFIKREGVYYGQCSEICGVNHGFMPIAVNALPPEIYFLWLLNKLGYYPI